MLQAVALWLALGNTAVAEQSPFRVATYNTSLHRPKSLQLAAELEGECPQARQVAEVLQRIRPDIVLLNEFDYDSDGRAAAAFLGRYLAKPQSPELQPLSYPHRFLRPVNTGRPSGRDLNKDGERDGPADAVGFGLHHGQYGMLVLSRFPIDQQASRTFQQLLWKQMPDALLPGDSRGGSYYDDEDLAVLRLSSKSHWDVHIRVDDRVLHLLASHPTPPVFDGKEDRNGRRNHDEIRFWADYLGGTAPYLVDDQGRRGGLAESAEFVVVGDLNADPQRGESRENAIGQLLTHPRVSSRIPFRRTGIPSQPDQSAASENPATASFGGGRQFRVDYALPSKRLLWRDAGVFWPEGDAPGAKAIAASDHRPVWVDLQWPAAADVP
ncbi:MAG: endonuclease/exonuclease/phosphatase family protein [Planctomycetales bacterium]|nr:endonuclease/exonuclease/phosphatase family protein [Planctomycetales bacterium]